MSDAWDIERDRQTQQLSTALQTVIDEFGQKLKAEQRVPMLNAVAGAIVTVSGQMLASIEDRRLRKQLRHRMEQMLPRAIAASEGRSGRAEVINYSRRSDA